MPISCEPRLIVTAPASAAWNMALDEVLLAGAATGPPVLRIYGWDPPAVSLGYGQACTDIDSAACASRGIAITRRLTGGRAVLHHLEFTYSIAVSAVQLGTGRSIQAAYGLLSGGLIVGLAHLGLEAACTPRHRAEAPGHEAACFASTLGGDLSVGGRKLLGSAQCHRGGGILQHGSLPTAIDDDLQAACLGRRGAARGWTCLRELGVATTAEALAEALADGLAPALGSRPRPSPLSTPELEAAADLAATKYATTEWRDRR